jgi:hypothetical protein
LDAIYAISPLRRIAPRFEYTPFEKDITQRGIWYANATTSELLKNIIHVYAM